MQSLCDILDAQRGHAREEYERARAMFAAQGHELPPYGFPAKKKRKADWGQKFRFFARKHNARLKADGNQGR